MNNYVDDKHIREMIFNGELDLFPAVTSFKAEDHLKKCFVLNNRTTTWIVDWNAVPSTELKWSEVSDDDAIAWAKRETLAGQCAQGLLVYSFNQPCLAGDFNFMIRHLDELTWKAPGNRLLFGVDRGSDREVMFGHGIIEFNGKDELRGSR